jgi:hypothetical protein
MGPHHAEANLSALIESTEDLIWSVDLDYRLLTFQRGISRQVPATFWRPAIGGDGAGGLAAAGESGIMASTI